ncbi:MAG: hypothetical protein Q7K43_00175 [Candidatus Woesearchaeota archaeon]|nr:hypothetical protein [Candidatus Woesearchaeota archaeon]
MNESNDNQENEASQKKKEPSEHPATAAHHPVHHKPEPISPTMIYAIMGVAAILILFNWAQIWSLSTTISPQTSFSAKFSSPVFASSGSLDDVDISTIQNTAQAVNALFPLKDIKSADDAIKVMIPSGPAVWASELGISYDDPVTALNFLAQKLYPAMKSDLQQNAPELWKRYLDLATKPVGISCEYCCGVGPVSVTPRGELTCGCAHNPAVHAVTMYLMKNTKMSDAEILQEVMKWKSLWFPKDMVGLALKLSGGDTSALKNVPGMVGGC